MSVYVPLALVTALLAAVSALAKLRQDPRVVKVIRDVVGVPLAAAGLTLYFVGAVVAHLRVGDLKGIGPAAFLLTMAGACLATRYLGV